ncbi:AAA family ATPase [Acidianus brierleyi]|uniref:AAA family ATPase n=1 Tax=Acidianus brierleyi TaxID=41673 RepID=A0A2U9IIU8_9CREN|nr:AAA family ATPase [Acidianus brierleyi]
MSEFIFKESNLVSIYGASGRGKTIIGLQVAKEFSRSIFISSEGYIYKSRVSNIYFKNVLFADVSTSLELMNSILKAMLLEPSVIVVDTINKFYRIDKKYKGLLYPLMLLSEYSKYGKVLLFWQVSMNNKVSGEKFMRYFSGDVLRLANGNIIGNLRNCKFKISEDGVIGCL